MGDYSSKAEQARRNAKAAREYKEALADPTLDPAVRAILEEEVVLDPGTGKERRVKRPAMHEDYQVKSNQGECDAAELPVAAELPAIADLVDRKSDELCEKFQLKPWQGRAIWTWHTVECEEQVKRESALKLGKAVGSLFANRHSPTNQKQTLYALMFVTRIASVNGLRSMREASKDILKADGTPVTVASLSKEANRLCSYLDLPPGEGMKSDESVLAYSVAQKKSHARRKSAERVSAISLFGTSERNQINEQN